MPDREEMEAERNGRRAVGMWTRTSASGRDGDARENDRRSEDRDDRV